MKTICLYFEVHIPYALKRYRFFEIGNDHYYYDDFANEDRVRYLAEKSFLPANNILLELIKNMGKSFSCTFSLSGSAIEQLEQYAPEVIDSFQELAKTGQVEFLAEPYGHSMASLYDENEFERQVIKHSDKIKELFGKKPTSFRNTDFIYSDEIGEKVSSMGYKVMLMEGAKHILGWRSPNYVYSHAYLPKLKLLARNFLWSNQITFHFSNPSWNEYPLTADKLIDWIAGTPEGENIHNLWMSYDTFGAIQKDYTGIFEFLKALPYVDANRMALCGWSYGGYQTLMCLSQQSSMANELVWQCGIAIAPVTSWRLYDSAYTERFMRRPQVNDFGYEGTDLMKMASNLTGDLLLVHGLADDNVHAQNSLLYIDALVKAGKQFDMQFYVDDNHSIRKPANSKHLHEKILLFLKNKL